MVLGEQLEEGRGKVTATRVLDDGKIEVSMEGKGKLLGSDFTEITTFWSEMRANGTAYGEGNFVQIFADGMVGGKVYGFGRLTEQGGWKYSFNAMYRKATSQKLARLLEVCVVGEYEADAEGNFHTKTWEWKY